MLGGVKLSKELGKFLEQLRGKMSLREAAEKSGLSHTYIRDLEKGVNRTTRAPIQASHDTIKRLAKAYNYDENKLMVKAGIIEDVNMDIINEGQIIAKKSTGYLSNDKIEELLLLFDDMSKEDQEYIIDLVKRISKNN